MRSSPSTADTPSSACTSTPHPSRFCRRESRLRDRGAAQQRSRGGGGTVAATARYPVRCRDVTRRPRGRPAAARRPSEHRDHARRGRGAGRGGACVRPPVDQGRPAARALAGALRLAYGVRSSSAVRRPQFCRRYSGGDASRSGIAAPAAHAELCSGVMRSIWPSRASTTPDRPPPPRTSRHPQARRTVAAIRPGRRIPPGRRHSARVASGGETGSG